MAEDEHNQRAKVGSDNVEDDKKMTVILKQLKN